VNLYKSMGGGWVVTAEELTAQGTGAEAQAPLSR
jgi:hypothetical protein